MSRLFRIVDHDRRAQLIWICAECLAARAEQGDVRVRCSRYAPPPPNGCFDCAEKGTQAAPLVPLLA